VTLVEVIADFGAAMAKAGYRGSISVELDHQGAWNVLSDLTGCGERLPQYVRVTGIQVPSHGAVPVTVSARAVER
jgi:hypothetical protein